MDSNEVYAAMILLGLTFEALWVTNFIEISVYIFDSLHHFANTNFGSFQASEGRAEYEDLVELMRQNVND